MPTLSVLTKSPCFAMKLLCPCSLHSELERTRNASTLSPPPNEGILRALLACQAQNRTTISSKSGDGSHVLRLTDTATVMQPGTTILISKLERHLSIVNKAGEH